MSTRLTWLKTGLVLTFDVSAAPAPRVRQVYPYPDLAVQTVQMLDAELATIDSTGRTGIRVTSRGTDLPGSAAAVFSVIHRAVQSALSTREVLPVTGRQVDLLLDHPIPSALHSFALQRVDGGQTTTWPEITVATPAPAGTSSNFIPNGDSEQGAISGVGGHGVLDTNGLEASGYGGSRYVRSTKLITAGVNDVLSQMIPCEVGDVIVWSYNHRIRDIGSTAAYVLRVFPTFYDSSNTDLGSGTVVGGKNSYLLIGGGPWPLPGQTWPNDWLAGIGQATAPANAAYCLLRILPGSSNEAEFWVDNMVADVAEVATSTLLGSVKVTPGAYLKLASGVVSLDEDALHAAIAAGGGSGGSGGIRATVNVVSGLLAPRGTANLQIDLAKSADIICLATDYPAWVRIYATAAARTADADRDLYTWPDAGRGVVADTVCGSGALTVWQDPEPSFSNKDTPPTATAYLAVTNFDAVARDITVTVTYLPKEV